MPAQLHANASAASAASFKSASVPQSACYRGAAKLKLGEQEWLLKNTDARKMSKKPSRQNALGRAAL
jgi:hypothetical protein